MIGGEHHEDVERHLKLLAGTQREIVDPAFERHDPAVQQVARRRVLTAEVIDDQHAAVGERLKRRRVEPERLVESKLQRRHRQLAADRDQRPPAAHPAMVERMVFFQSRIVSAVVDALVIDRVEQADDLSFDRQRMGNRDLALKDVANRLGDDGLAVARRPVDEQRVPCGNRGTKLIEHPAIQHQV